jgi:hypothetical protein
MYFKILRVNSHLNVCSDFPIIYRIAEQYQKLDGFSALPPQPGRIVISLNEDTTDSESSSEDDCDSDLSVEEVDLASDDDDHEIPSVSSNPRKKRKQDFPSSKTLFLDDDDDD